MTQGWRQVLVFVPESGQCVTVPQIVRPASMGQEPLEEMKYSNSVGDVVRGAQDKGVRHLASIAKGQASLLE